MTTATSHPRGKAALPRHLRPGYVIKDTLSGTIPLIHRSPDNPEVIEESIVYEAAIQELSFSYKQIVKRENQTRPRARRLRGMTYSSFVKIFKFAQLLGLVELVREEPMIYSPGQLLSIRNHARRAVVDSVRRVFKLTEDGAAEDAAWRDLRRAWSEGWPIPTALTEVELPVVEEWVPPTAAPTVEEAPPPTEVPPVPISIGTKLGRRSMRRVAGYLDYIHSMPRSPELASALDTIVNRIGDWEIDLEDTIEHARARGDNRAVSGAQARIAELVEVREALEQGNITGASELLTKAARH